MDNNDRRHCWECRRRCLVCDSTKPSCKRCSTSGTTCPGYGHVKPARIRWVEPGRVTSRARRRPKQSCHDAAHEEKKYVISTRNSSPAFPISNTGIPSFSLSVDPTIVPAFQVAEYFNACIYQDLKPELELGHNPHIYELTARMVQEASSAPQFLQHGMYCIVLSHRLNRTRESLPEKALNEKFYLHRGLAIRSLSDHLNTRYDGMDEVIMAGILMLLLTDIHHGALHSWQCHLEGVQKIIGRRGGFNALAEFHRAEPLVLPIWFLTVMGHTTCPVSYLAATDSDLDAVDFMLERNSIASFPVGMCPPPLFAEVVRINRLRSRAAMASGTEKMAAALDAYETLDRIQAFSPVNWVESKSLTSKHDWIRVSKAYQASVALYCILALQSTSLLPETPVMRSQCAAYDTHLQSLLVECLASPRTKRFMIWPLVVLGVEAVHDAGGAAARAFVAERLPELSRDLGTHVPLTAKSVLEAFWASGKKRWDGCFDRQYIFTTQIAPDTSRLFPLYQRAATG